MCSRRLEGDAAFPGARSAQHKDAAMRGHDRSGRQPVERQKHVDAQALRQPFTVESAAELVP